MSGQSESTPDSDLRTESDSGSDTDTDTDLDSGSDTASGTDTASDTASGTEPPAETDADAFDNLLAFVEAELNFATSHYNDSYLDRRISSRMRRTQTDTYTEYVDLLHSDPDEQASLLESFSINVTGFFRNPEVWDGIRQILRHCSARRQDTDEPVRIWSAACADGREPYSLSLLAHLDPEIDADTVEILGTDISEPALETARDGVYEAPRTVDLDDQLSFLEPYDEHYEQYVERQGRTYKLDDDVRQSVTFERHDLINDEPKSTADFDLVVCRNLFIYIDNEFKRPILQTIARSLTDDGFLVIGKAETIPPSLKSAFEVRDARRRIYRCDKD
ncbi:CheR-type MCP methyltransferase [Natrialba hulunbeirensis JCM 10989]|uniref:protein-glutamate O-methyltransferase n=1 Tax=Natrialba hulunbeirensis JCM 10989 TaxID=1227493 RepID=L9ZR35_9EURY|nr:protein-glutamate O-methyltransferase CheR [Natrialba hulunbeirensis]ELY87608.1 CheR-type MCP methyltransferase [Natrialba hulunbeirensis JCM 10989]